VPLFLVVGWDDNGYSGLPGSGGDGGMRWALDLAEQLGNPPGQGQSATFDGSPARFSFYMTTLPLEGDAARGGEPPALLRRVWAEARDRGHELGIHTHRHLHGAKMSREGWAKEIRECQDWLGRAPGPAGGVAASVDSLTGFRAPFLEYNGAALQAAQAAGLRYDCSIEEGFQPDQDGTNFLWPYTLDEGSPGHRTLVKWELKPEIGRYPGLWELPAYVVIAPPDQDCERLGTRPGLRARLKQRQSWFDTEGGKITGFDYNLWELYNMDEGEALATLRHTMELRLRGNRAPLLFGAHTDFYSSKYTAPPRADVAARRRVMETFLREALRHPDVRVVSARQLLDWLRAPVALR